MLDKSELERAIKLHEQKANDSYESCEKLAHLYALHDRYFSNDRAKQSNDREENATSSELKDIFPALADYQHTRSISDFRALCNEIEEFCKAVYVSTTNDDERRIYRQMIEHIKK